jgi:hypothetical protein
MRHREWFEGFYPMADGERCVMVLIKLLSRQVRVRAAPANLRKLGRNISQSHDGVAKYRLRKAICSTPLLIKA